MAAKDTNPITAAAAQRSHNIACSYYLCIVDACTIATSRASQSFARHSD